MRLLLICGLISYSAAAQYNPNDNAPPQKHAVSKAKESEDSTPVRNSAEAEILEWASGCQRCDLINRNGLKWIGLRERGIAVWINFHYADVVNTVNLQVENRSGSRLETGPSLVGLVMRKPKSKVFGQYSPENMAQYLLNQGNVGDLADSLGWAIARLPKKDRTLDHLQAQENAQALLRSAFRANTLMDGESAAGSMYFERDKKESEMRLYFYVRGDLTLEFPLDRLAWQ